MSETNSTEAIFTLDTGSEISLIKASSLKPSAECKKDRVSIIGIHPSMKTESIGSTNLNIGNGIKHNFYIMADSINIQTDGIIGLDFLKRFNARVNMAKMTLEIGHPVVQHQPNQPNLSSAHESSSIPTIEPEQIFLSPSASQTISPLSKAMLKINLPTEEDLLCLKAEPIEGLLIGDTLLNKNSPFIAVINTTMKPIHVDPNALNLKFIKAEEFLVASMKTANHNERASHIKSNLLFGPHNSEAEKTAIKNICEEFADIFYLEGDILSHTDLVEHRIPIKEGSAPVFTRQYRFPQSQQTELNRQVEKLEEQGIIEPSFSPWNSPLLLVNKKKDSAGNKQYRLVVDFRKVNEATADQSFPIPIIEEIIDLLG